MLPKAIRHLKGEELKNRNLTNKIVENLIS